MNKNLNLGKITSSNGSLNDGGGSGMFYIKLLLKIYIIFVSIFSNSKKAGGVYIFSLFISRENYR